MISLLRNIDSLDNVYNKDEGVSEVGGVCHCIQEGWHINFVIFDYFCTEILFDPETIGNLIIQQQNTGHTWGTQQLIHTRPHVGLVII